jgi:hypothetical protein
MQDIPKNEMSEDEMPLVQEVFMPSFNTYFQEVKLRIPNIN